jgi:hypothetical protein
MRRHQRGFLLNPYRFGGDGGEWTPANLANPPKIWVNEQSEVTDAGGGSCSQWNDISGNNWHFEQPTSSDRPAILAAELNGKRVIRFDGSNDRMYHGAGGANIYRNTGYGWAATLYKKRSTSTGSASSVVFYTNASSTAVHTNRFNVISSRGSTPTFGAFAARTGTTDSTAVIGRSASDVGAWVARIDIADWSNGDVYTYVNGELDASALDAMNAGTTSDVAGPGLIIGAGGTALSPNTNTYSDIDLAELVAGSGAALTTDDIDKIFGYLMHRWGLADSLSAMHPYKISPP